MKDPNEEKNSETPEETEELLMIPATMSKMYSMADGCLRIQVDADRELKPETSQKFFSMLRHSGYFIFKLQKFTQEDLTNLPEEKREEKGQKTASEILRNRMFVFYRETHGGKTEGFEDWRKRELDQYGMSFLKKLNS